jgi:Putative transmembrane protein (PGPGW)
VTTLDRAKRLARIITGFTLLGAGVLMLALPGPGLVTIAIGLALLGAEYMWAKRLLERIKAGGAHVKGRLSRRAAERRYDK